MDAPPSLLARLPAVSLHSPPHDRPTLHVSPLTIPLESWDIQDLDPPGDIRDISVNLSTPQNFTRNIDHIDLCTHIAQLIYERNTTVTRRSYSEAYSNTSRHVSPSLTRLIPLAEVSRSAQSVCMTMITCVSCHAEAVPQLLRPPSETAQRKVWAVERAYPEQAKTTAAETRRTFALALSCP